MPTRSTSSLQACDAVAEAHALGIIHRDLKPENFFSSRRRDGSPHVKVLDFGISKLGVESTSHKGRRVVTQENTVLGSPTYMAPEQVRNSKRVDERSDIWSLGVSLYELLTAAEPFGAESIPEIFVNVLTMTPAAPDQVVAEIPPELSAIVMRCLEKEPAARFQSVGELASRALALRHGQAGVGRADVGRRRDEQAPDSSSSLVRRLAPPTRPPFKPMVIAPRPLLLPTGRCSRHPRPCRCPRRSRSRLRRSRDSGSSSVSRSWPPLLLAGGASGVVEAAPSHEARAAALPVAPPSGEARRGAPRPSSAASAVSVGVTAPVAVASSTSVVTASVRVDGTGTGRRRSRVPSRLLRSRRRRAARRATTAPKPAGLPSRTDVVVARRAAVATLCSASRPSSSQTSRMPTTRRPKAAAAQQLFDEALKLMDSRRFAEACPKLARSQELAPSGGTLLNLGDCYEKNGQTASAWVSFRDAAARAATAGQKHAQAAALVRADALAAKLVHLKLTLAPDARRPGLEIKRDGESVSNAELGIDVPVDPGTHKIEATAPGYVPWTKDVTVSPGRRSRASSFLR